MRTRIPPSHPYLQSRHRRATWPRGPVPVANRHPLARRAHLPPHSLSVFIPLVDLTPANGPTEFQLGTHVKANLVKPQRRCAAAESGSDPGSEFEYLHPDLRGPATASESATPRSPQMRRRLRGGRPRHLRHACDAPWRTEWIRRGQARHHTVGPRVSVFALTCADKIYHLGQADGVSHVQPRVVPRHPQPVTRVKFQAASTSERRARAPWDRPAGPPPAYCTALAYHISRGVPQRASPAT